MVYIKIYNFLSQFFMDFRKIMKNVLKIHLKPWDMLIYLCENDNFDKHDNVFRMCNIYIKPIFLSDE